MSIKVCRLAVLASAPPPLLDVFAQSDPVGQPVSAMAVSGLLDASSATAFVQISSAGITMRWVSIGGTYDIVLLVVFPSPGSGVRNREVSKPSVLHRRSRSDRSR